MALLDATGPEAAMTEARDSLRASPGSATTHVFDGERFVGSVEAPAFGFAATNNTADFGASAFQEAVPTWLGRAQASNGDRG